MNLKFDVTNNKGQVIQFGSIGGGGRYDNLVNNFGNYDAPATGISIGLDRLVYALMQKKEFKVKHEKIKRHWYLLLYQPNPYYFFLDG